MVPLHVEKGVFGGVERSGAKFVHLNGPLCSVIPESPAYARRLAAKPRPVQTIVRLERRRDFWLSKHRSSSRARSSGSNRLCLCGPAASRSASRAMAATSFCKVDEADNSDSKISRSRLSSSPTAYAVMRGSIFMILLWFRGSIGCAGSPWPHEVAPRWWTRWFSRSRPFPCS